MLKGISPLLSPELLSILMSMGHGDRIVFGDGNFPGESNARRGGAHFVRLDGQGVTALLDAILPLFPLDSYVPQAAFVMERTEQDRDLPLPILDEYAERLALYDDRGSAAIGSLSREAFYEAARNAFCIVQTGETAIYANLILQKGVVQE